MGFWGLDLYDNDTTSDIKNYCEIQFFQAFNAKQVQDKALQKFGELIGTDEEPLFWLVLADVAYNFGDISDEIKNKALTLIDKYAFVENFDDLSDRKKWRETLDALKMKLNSASVLKNKTVKKSNINRHNWKTGDVFSFCFKSDWSKKIGLYEKYILFQALTDEEYDDFGYLSIVVQFFNKAFINIPNNLDIKKLNILPVDNANTFFDKNLLREMPLNVTARMEILDEGDLPEDQISFIKNQQVVNKDIHEIEVGYPTGLFWNDLEEYICDYCWLSWQDYSLKINDGKLVILKNKMQ